MTAGMAAISGTMGQVNESRQQVLARQILEYGTALRTWEQADRSNRGPKPTRPVLKGQDLSGIALYGFNLEGWDLSESFGTNIGLAGANLKRANLRGARWQNVALTGAVLTHVRVNQDTSLTQIGTGRTATPYGGGPQVTDMVVWNGRQLPFTDLSDKLGEAELTFVPPRAVVTGDEVADAASSSPNHEREVAEA